MSKYLGKLLLESGIVSGSYLDSVLVHYVKSKDAFCFRYEHSDGAQGVGGIFYAGAGLVNGLCAETGYLECQYQFSVGYTVRPLKGIESIKEMRMDELEMLGGRRSLILSGQLDNDDDFDMLCAIQYLFKFSASFFDRVKGHWRRDHSYVEMERRKVGKCGRKKGGKNKKDAYNEEESLEDLLLRVRHNKKVAVQRGILEWYLEACKEESKALDLKFNKDKCLEEWNNLRRECE